MTRIIREHAPGEAGAISQEASRNDGLRCDVHLVDEERPDTSETDDERR